MRREEVLLRAVLVLLSILLLFVPVPVQSRGVDPPTHVAPPVRGPRDYRPQPLDRSGLRPLRSQSDGLKAVAIVGEVGDLTSIFKGDMDVAVQALQNHGVAVERFYYGDRSFGWGDIVAAAAGAHMLLYMGHGVKWGGSWSHPTLVGGLFLGNESVHPDQIRSDLAGWMADDAVVILSHVCYSAGEMAYDGSGEPSQAEAERRVRMYAAPFVDVGLEAYFANNYFDSAANYVNELLTDPDHRKNVGDVFKSVYPYSSSQFRDLSYPGAAGYDLWLSGAPGYWSDAFVGIPGYVFSGDVTPAELGPLPASLAFTYNSATTQLSPADHTLAPTNVASEATLTWSVSKQGDWFAVSTTGGTTPHDRITITPVAATIASLPVGHYDGSLTVTVTDPADTVNGVQQVDLGLDIVVPRLGGLPSRLGFTYFLSETIQIPSLHRVTPENVGSNDELTWELSYTGDWLTVSPTSGETDEAFTVAPVEMTITEPVTYTGLITVTVTAPAGTADPVQTIRTSFCARSGGPAYVYLPLIARH